MKKFNRLSVVLVVLVGLLGVSSVALAGHDDEHKEDTQFSWGVDEENNFLAINIWENYDPVDCYFENGTLYTTYGEETDGVIPVNELFEDEGRTIVKEFEPRDETYLPEGVDPAVGPTLYDGADNDCGAYGIVIGDKLNHGQVMKALNELMKESGMQGRGCLNRHVAKSDAGKDADNDGEWTFGTEGEIDFTTVEADCYHGKKDKGEDHPSAQSDRPRGKSATAPGKNK